VRGVVGTDGGMLETLMNENPARAVCPDNGIADANAL